MHYFHRRALQQKQRRRWQQLAVAAAGGGGGSTAAVAAPRRRQHYSSTVCVSVGLRAGVRRDVMIGRPPTHSLSVRACAVQRDPRAYIVPVTTLRYDSTRHRTCASDVVKPAKFSFKNGYKARFLCFLSRGSAGSLFGPCFSRVFLDLRMRM